MNWFVRGLIGLCVWKGKEKSPLILFLSCDFFAWTKGQGEKREKKEQNGVGGVFCVCMKVCVGGF